MFLDEVLGLPPKLDIDFTINLVPREAPISKYPYRMNAKIGRVKDAAIGINGQEVYKTKCVSLRSACVICQE